MNLLFIDTGHSAKWPGAMGLVKEHEWVRLIADALPMFLHPSKYDLVRVPDKFATDWSANRNLSNRISWINKEYARRRQNGIVISIHGNSGPSSANGIEVAYMGGTSADKPAEELARDVANATGLKIRRERGIVDDRTTRHGRLGMVRDTTPLALLVECGFVSSPVDMAVPAAKYAQGIANFLNTL